MGRYKAPRKFNFISIIVGIAVLGGLYSAVRFGPVYYRKWQVKSVLSEAAAKAHAKRVFNPKIDDGPEQVGVIVEWTEDKLRKLGVTDATMSVTIYDGEDGITAKAQYIERIKHPLVNKTTTLYFRPFVTVTKGSGFD
jgi:hypothetical protein